MLIETMEEEMVESSTSLHECENLIGIGRLISGYDESLPSTDFRENGSIWELKLEESEGKQNDAKEKKNKRRHGRTRSSVSETCLYYSNHDFGYPHVDWLRLLEFLDV